MSRPPLLLVILPLLLLGVTNDDNDDACHTYAACVEDCGKVDPSFCGPPADYCRGLPESCESAGCSITKEASR